MFVLVSGIRFSLSLATKVSCIISRIILGVKGSLALSFDLFCGKLLDTSRALGSAVERFPDGKRIRRRRIRVRGSVVERRPDKTKVLGSIPSAPTKYA